MTPVPQPLTGRRVLIRVDGDHLIGLGHIYRMRTLAQGLASRGAEVTMLTLAGTVGGALLREAGLRVREVARADDHAALRSVVGALQPAIVIVDILETTTEALRALRPEGGSLLTVDDVGAGLRLADAVINPIVFHWGRYRPEDSRARLFEGPAYMILQPEVAGYTAHAPEISPLGERVLLAFGGTDTRNVTERMLEALNRVGRTLTLRVNLGPGAIPSSRFDTAVTGTLHRLTVMRGCPSLIAEFAAADLVICAGGVTLYELAALGIPAAAVATEDHEAVNIAYWTAQGTTIPLGYHATLDLDHVAGEVEKLLSDRPMRQSMAMRGHALVDGRGLSRCLDVIAEIAP